VAVTFLGNGITGLFNHAGNSINSVNSTPGG
jgi:hypothetical protein